MSIADKIRKASDTAREIIEVPEWDVQLEIRSLSAKKRAQLQNFLGDDTQASDRQEAMWGLLLTSCCFDPESGEPVFQPEDVEWLLDEKSFAVIDRLTSKALEVSAIGNDAEDEAGKSS